MTGVVDQMEYTTPFPVLLDERVLDLPDRLLDLLPVGVYVCDQAGLIVRYNRAAAELWGCSPEIGDPSVRFCGSYRLYGLNGDLIPHAKCPMGDVLATGQGLRDQEIIIERPDGARVIALVNIEAIKDSSGFVVGAVNVFREKPRQQAVHLNGHSRNSDKILQALPVAVYTTDADGHITFYNEAAAELWGVEPELGKSEFCGSWKLYWPDGTPLPHHECPMALALKEQRPITGMEAIAERPDGTRVPFIPFPMPLFDASGTLIGGVNTLVDISERHKAEQRIRESEARYRDIAAIVESSEDAVLTKDLDGIITSWNHGASRLFGYAADEVIGKPITILIPDERHDEEPTILTRIRRGERIDHYETVRRRKDGSSVDISLTVSPVRNPEGEIIGASKIARDIAERRRAERTAAPAAQGDGPPRQEPVCPGQRCGGPQCAHRDLGGRTLVGGAESIDRAGAGARAYAAGDVRGWQADRAVNHAARADPNHPFTLRRPNGRRRSEGRDRRTRYPARRRPGDDLRAASA